MLKIGTLVTKDMMCGMRISGDLSEGIRGILAFSMLLDRARDNGFLPMNSMPGVNLLGTFFFAGLSYVLMFFIGTIHVESIQCVRRSDQTIRSIATIVNYEAEQKTMTVKTLSLHMVGLQNY